jgi:hypothetical protein
MNPDSKKVCFVPYETNPGFVSYRGSRILTLKDSLRIVNHESIQSFLQSCFTIDIKNWKKTFFPIPDWPKAIPLSGPLCKYLKKKKKKNFLYLNIFNFQNWYPMLFPRFEVLIIKIKNKAVSNFNLI